MLGNFGAFSRFSFANLKTNLFCHHLCKCNFIILNFDFYCFSIYWTARQNFFYTSSNLHHVYNNVWNFHEDWFTSTPLNFKTNLTCKPDKNPLYNVQCFDVMLTVSKLMPIIHTSMISTFQWGDFGELKSKNFSGKACPLGARLGNRPVRPSSAPASNDLFILNTVPDAVFVLST